MVSASRMSSEPHTVSLATLLESCQYPRQNTARKQKVFLTPIMYQRTHTMPPVPTATIISINTFRKPHSSVRRSDSCPGRWVLVNPCPASKMAGRITAERSARSADLDESPLCVLPNWSFVPVADVRAGLSASTTRRVSISLRSSYTRV